METATREVDLHRLDLRFADSRLIEPRAVEQLARSIERAGQLIACIAVVEDGGERLVVVDGYRRIAALRRLGHDTATIESWNCDLTQALLAVLARSHGRAFAAIEEALLLRELVHSQGLSQHEVARRSGRDVSWVSRRLQLVCAMPDTLLAAVREGSLSTWAAIRVMAPLARANPEHAQRLLASLDSHRLTTRQLHRWFEHYQGSAHRIRERLVANPRLFIDVLHAKDEQRADERVRQGPEGQCALDLRQVLALIARVRRCLQQLGPEGLAETLVPALTRVRNAAHALQSELGSYLDHDPHRDPQQRANPPGAGPQTARDQSPAQALA
jgi:ParB family transcriptional regulator, chromosome partitioning protein